MANEIDIVMMDAHAMARAIRDGRLSCVDVMNAHLDQVERLNPRVNAIVALRDRDDLVRQAAAKDDELARGATVGPLHGLPHAVKDLQPVKGLPFTQGSPIFRDVIATEDSLEVARLRAAGVIFIGKTNTPEFGLGSHTYNSVYGLTRNPYDLDKSAGGSSGGAAVALALRMTPLADGSDYGGSLRNPAGWNNVFGFRPSIGRVPVQARDDWLPSMGVVGPMARTVSDLALLLSVQAGPDPRAPLAMESGGDPFLEPLACDVRGQRIGWIGDFGGFAPCEAGVLDTCRTALNALESLGCIVEDALPDYPLEPVWRAFLDLRAWQAGSNLRAYYDDPDRRALMKPEAIFEVEAGARLSAFDVSAAALVRTEWSRAVRALFERHDYLVVPTAQVFPFEARETWPREIAGQAKATYHEWMKAVCLVTMSGCPALASPAGFGPEGLPIGIQIIAPVRREMDCLRLAYAYEQATDWTGRRPPEMLAR